MPFPTHNETHDLSDHVLVCVGLEGVRPLSLLEELRKQEFELSRGDLDELIEELQDEQLIDLKLSPEGKLTLTARGLITFAHANGRLAEGKS